MKLFSAIQKRRSIRSFIKKRVSQDKITAICQAARWAPSGLNNQPWRFIIVQDKEIKEKISSFTEYRSVIKRADFIIVVFLDKKESYHRIKDAQAMGACIQNMLLCAFELGISSCWMGEILNKKVKVRNFFSLKPRYDLMAAVAFGYSKRRTKSYRLPLKKLILKTI